MQKYRSKIRELRKQLRTPRCVVNQAVKRQQSHITARDQQYKELKKKLRSNLLAKEVADLKAEIFKLKKTQFQRLRRKKLRRAQKVVSIQQYRQINQKLKERNNEVRVLDFDNVLLKERPEESGNVIQSKIL